jgi:hypothetical protein
VLRLIKLNQHVYFILCVYMRLRLQLSRCYPLLGIIRLSISSDSIIEEHIPLKHQTYKLQNYTTFMLFKFLYVLNIRTKVFDKLFLFIHLWLYNTLLGPDLFFSFVIFFFTQLVGLFERAISPSQCRYLHTGQHKHRINAHRHLWLEWDSNPRSQRSSEDSLCLRFQGHRLFIIIVK